jgi:hypothetical protein
MVALPFHDVGYEFPGSPSCVCGTPSRLDPEVPKSWSVDDGGKFFQVGIERLVFLVTMRFFQAP